MCYGLMRGLDIFVKDIVQTRNLHTLYKKTHNIFSDIRQNFSYFMSGRKTKLISTCRDNLRECFG